MYPSTGYSSRTFRLQKETVESEWSCKRSRPSASSPHGCDSPLAVLPQVAYFDAFTPAYRWLYESGRPWSWHSRDYVHSGEFGKQVIGRVLLEYFLSGKGD